LLNDSSLVDCYHNMLNKDSARKALKNFEKRFEEKEIDVNFDLDYFDVSGGSFVGVVNVSILDNSSSFVFYDFLNDSMKLDFVGLKFAIKAGNLINNEYQQKANTLVDKFKDCGNLGILSKNNLCNYFGNGSKYVDDLDGNDPYIPGECYDYFDVYEDKCFGNYLFEYVAYGKLCKHEIIACNECKENRCKPSSCVDSDGLDYSNKGYVKYDGRIVYDFCKDDKTVSEFYCDSGYVSIKNYECYCYCDEGKCGPAECVQLYQIIFNSFGHFCGSPLYNPVADLNKDRIVDMLDTAIFGKHVCDASFCESALSDTTNPCT